MSWKLTLLAVTATGFVGIQFVPVDQSNPPVEADAQTPSAVKAILKRSCYDCHSDETNWPWYSRIAPMSWLVSRDVHEGREHLNFSKWGTLPTKDLIDKTEEVWEEVEEGEMPLWFYLPMHPEARLSAEDKKTLRKWTLTDRRLKEDDD